MLDLSAAFGSIDNAFLLGMYVSHDQAFVLISYYICDTPQRVNIRGTLSDTQELSFGVLQGSVLGMILCCFCTKSV